MASRSNVHGYVKLPEGKSGTSSEINDDFYGKSDCKSIQPKTAENLSVWQKSTESK